MKRILYMLVFTFLSFSLFAQQMNDGKERDLAFNNATNKWFSAWELTSKQMYKIQKLRPVDFVFFDDKFVYSTSDHSVHAGYLVNGHNFMNLRFQWKRKLHNDSITLPDNTVLPVGLMSFAAQNTVTSKPFFVMPLPGFWKQAGVSSKELGIDNLITGVFLHEFSHSQQMQNFGKKITEFEKQHKLKIDFNDDIVQNIFSKDTGYLKYYTKEIEFFYSSIENNMFNQVTIRKGLSMLKERQAKYLAGSLGISRRLIISFLQWKDLVNIQCFCG